MSQLGHRACGEGWKVCIAAAVSIYVLTLLSAMMDLYVFIGQVNSIAPGKSWPLIQARWLQEESDLHAMDQF